MELGIYRFRKNLLFAFGVFRVAILRFCNSLSITNQNKNRQNSHQDVKYAKLVSVPRYLTIFSA
jgi:hypothetical protein